MKCKIILRLMLSVIVVSCGCGEIPVTKDAINYGEVKNTSKSITDGLSQRLLLEKITITAKNENSFTLLSGDFFTDDSYIRSIK